MKNYILFFWILCLGETPGNFDLVLVNDQLDSAYKKLRTFLMPDISELREYVLKLNSAYQNGSGDKAT